MIYGIINSVFLSNMMFKKIKGTYVEIFQTNLSYLQHSIIILVSITLILSFICVVSLYQNKS